MSKDYSDYKGLEMMMNDPDFQRGALLGILLSIILAIIVYRKAKTKP